MVDSGRDIYTSKGKKYSDGYSANNPIKIRSKLIGNRQETNIRDYFMYRLPAQLQIVSENGHFLCGLLSAVKHQIDVHFTIEISIVNITQSLSGW